MDKKYKILLVDDDKFISDLFIRKVKELGHVMVSL